MLKGEEVTVVYRSKTGTDGFNNDVYSDVEEAVQNVLVAPGKAQDATDTNRPDGVVVDYTLCFPKTYTGNLTWEEVVVRGHRCAVVGNPDRYDPCPTEWNMVVEVRRVDG